MIVLLLKRQYLLLMEHSLFHFIPYIRPDIYLKNPESSILGKNLIVHSIDLIDDIGFEEYNFKKLSQSAGTTEATVYRYFENKHKILLYLTSWYWSWVEYQLVLRNSNLGSLELKLQNAIQSLCTPEIALKENNYDITKLFNIVCHESSKSYMIKNVDELNKDGVYYNYKKIVAIISEIILEIDPAYPYPHTLVTTIIEGIHHQVFFGKHLPALTEKKITNGNLSKFYFDVALTLTLNHKNTQS